MKQLGSYHRQVSYLGSYVGWTIIKQYDCLITWSNSANYTICDCLIVDLMIFLFSGWSGWFLYDSQSNLFTITHQDLPIHEKYHFYECIENLIYSKIPIYLSHEIKMNLKYWSNTEEIYLYILYKWTRQIYKWLTSKISYVLNWENKNNLLKILTDFLFFFIFPTYECSPY